MEAGKYKEASRHNIVEDMRRDIELHSILSGQDPSIEPRVAWFHRLQKTRPVRYRPEYDLWEVFRYKDVEGVLSNAATFSMDKCVPPSMPIALGTADPLAHRQLRSFVSKAFTPRSLEVLTPHIIESIEELLKPGIAKGKIDDAMTELALPLAMRVIADMIGLPLSDQERFEQWAGQLRMLFVGVEHSVDHGEFLQYFSDLFDERKRDPRNDLITAMISAEGHEKGLENEKKYFLCMELMTGNLSVPKLLNFVLSRLGQHPEIYQDLRNDPSLIPGAIEETLRYDFNFDIWRTAHHDTVLGGQQIKAGQYVVAWAATANFDESIFPHSEQFDIRRSPNPHLTFGHGAHVCLGAHLARLEVRIALERIVAHFSEIRLNSEKSQSLVL